MLIDDALIVRLAVRVRDDGTVEVLEVRHDGSTTPFLDVPHEDAFTTSVWRFSRDGRSLFLQDSRGRDTAALIERDMQTGGQLGCWPKTETRISSAPGGIRALCARSPRWHWLAANAGI